MTLNALRLLVAVGLTSLALYGCKQSSEEQLAELQRQVAKRPIGMSPDYFLAKMGHDRVALIHGMADDFTFCLELAEFLAQKYPSDHFACIPAQ